jgi:hypothetical protein
MKDLKVTKVQYFQTLNGIAYKCQTNIPNLEIRNDGNGGATYLYRLDKVSNFNYYNTEYSEWGLELLICDYEGINPNEILAQ